MVFHRAATALWMIIQRQKIKTAAWIFHAAGRAAGIIFLDNGHTGS